MRIEKKASFPILNIIYSSTDGICYLEPAKGYDVDHVHAAKNFNGSDDKRYDTIPNLQLLGYDENRSKNDMSLSEWWDGKSPTEKTKYLQPANFSTDIRDFDMFFEKRKELLVSKLKESLGLPNLSSPSQVQNSSTLEGVSDSLQEELFERAQKTIERAKNNPKGSLREFIEKCKSSARLEKDGLAEP